MRTITCRNVDKYVQNYNKVYALSFRKSPKTTKLHLLNLDLQFSQFWVSECSPLLAHSSFL